MRVDISLLPALAAAFMLVFARIGAMVMLLPGLGESNIPVRINLGIPLVLTLVILPLHRAPYQLPLHHLVLAVSNDRYCIFSPGRLMPGGDIAAPAPRAFAAAFRIGMQLSAPFLVFGLVFNIGLGVLARLMPQMQVYFVGVPLSILAGFLIFALVITAMMGTFLDYFIGVMHDLIPLR